MNKIDEVSLFTCPKCNGIKKVEISNVTSKGYEKTEIVCSKCQGTGVLDWVEFVLGKKRHPFLKELEEKMMEVVGCYLFEINDEKTQSSMKSMISAHLNDMMFDKKIVDYTINCSPDKTINIQIEVNNV